MKTSSWVTVQGARIHPSFTHFGEFFANNRETYLDSDFQKSALGNAGDLPPAKQSAQQEATFTGEVHPQLNPLSVQAASLVRSIDSLSSIFWICFLGFFLSIFFAGLVQLEDTAYADYLFLGEYRIPKAILPLASLSFAVFAFWLVSNRLKMLGYVLSTSTLSFSMVRDLFHLNPPVLHVFDQDNENPWNPFSGISVFIFIWAVFFGNAIALVWAAVVQQGATLSEFDPVLMSVYALGLCGVMIYGIRSIVPPLRGILSTLHGSTFRVGWPRHTMGCFVIALTVFINEFDAFSSITRQDNDLIGPAYANAIDGETLYLKGVEVSLFGIDAVEPDQICQDSTGTNYPCGAHATQALQEMLLNDPVICSPLVIINERRVLAMCELTTNGPPPTEDEFTEGYRTHSLSRLMIVGGHAIGIGRGYEVYRDEQEEAQTLRRGIWQGSFVPPRLWRSSQP